MADSPLIEISIADQTLHFINKDEVIEFDVSTALNGPGEQEGTGCTPRGWHRIRAVIGDTQPENAVFIGRRSTGEVYNPQLAEQFPKRDWILSRILWLQGLESGVNRFGNVDSMRRYIYIHGTPDTEPMGTPLSHGCVRMRNNDVIRLTDLVTPGTLVWIQEKSFNRINCRNL